jgi:hypothetical protein
MKSFISICIFSLVLCANAYSQEVSTASCIPTFDMNFINKILYDTTSCNYFVAVPIEYAGKERVIMASESTLYNFLKYYLNFDLNACQQYIRNAIIHNKAIYIPSKEDSIVPLRFYMGFYEVGEYDSVFIKLSTHKEEFLNYYFDEDGEYKFTNNPEASIATKINLSTGKQIVFQPTPNETLLSIKGQRMSVFYQLFKWGIPVCISNHHSNGHYLKEWSNVSDD